MRSGTSRNTNMVLCVGHRRGVLYSLGDHLEGMGLKVVSCHDEKSIPSFISEHAPSAVILSLSKSTKEHFADIKSLVGKHPEIPFLVVSQNGTIREAVDLMRLGAYDYFEQPVDLKRFDASMRKALDYREMNEGADSRAAQDEQYQFDGMIGVSGGMQKIFRTIRNVAPTDANVFITGESGTGKELIAESLHLNSRRSAKPLITLNCAAIPDELLESELFGHEKGAFTGAYKRKIGSFQAADGGTIFLDEICEMPIELQAKLLRFIQERRFMRVGGQRDISVDVRLVAATNRDPVSEVGAGRFREDLYYRLLVVPIEAPPLRDRREDVPILAMHFLERFASAHERQFFEFTPEAMKLLINYSWPGNVRQLENVIENVVILHDTRAVLPSHLPEQILNHVPEYPDADKVEIVVKHLIPEEDKIVPFKEMERMVIENALKACDGNVVKAAKKLKIGQATVYRKIKTYGISA